VGSGEHSDGGSALLAGAVRELFLLHGECDAMTRVGTREGRRGHGAWAWLHVGPAGVLDQIGHVPINPLTSQSISRSMLRVVRLPSTK